MILKGSQRQGARQLATHLMNLEDNDHVTVLEQRGFASDTLYGAMAEAEGIAKGTKCRQHVFSLSLNPPKDAQVGSDGFLAAADRAEAALGLEGQPRAIVMHEKNGRAHAHVVWSRVDAESMTAINLPFFKRKLAALSKELFLENGWELPEGHKADGWKNPLNFTLAEWQQSKRGDLDPRELKQMIAGAWKASDSLPAFRHALEEHGLYLAKGDRRGFVAVDLNGEVLSLSRYAGVKPKEMEQRLGAPEALPSVAAVQDDLKARVRTQLREFIAQERAEKAAERKVLLDQVRDLVQRQRTERQRLEQGQKERWQAESLQRAAKFRQGVGVVLDVLTGRLFTLRRENEREAAHCLRRDRIQREALGVAQRVERAALQGRVDALTTRQRHQQAILARQIAQALKASRETHKAPREAKRQRERGGPELEL